MTIIKKYNLPMHGDKRGSLVALDDLSCVPFKIKRIYYIFKTDAGIARGFHAHRSTHQLAICIAGSCRMLIDNGHERESFEMNSPLEAIDLPPMLWHEMHDFSSDCMLLILASDYYFEKDYIRDYNEFKKLL